MSSLEELYRDAESVHTKIDNGESLVISDSLDVVLKAISSVEKNNIFSRNEELDDVATNCLKYLNLYYFLAQVHESVADLSLRKSHLSLAAKCYDTYIKKCMAVGIVSEKELEKLGLLPDDEDGGSSSSSATVFGGLTGRIGGRGTAAEEEDESIGGVSRRGGPPSSNSRENMERKRTQKIAKFKREKEIKNRIESLRRLVGHAGGSSSTTGGKSSIAASQYNKADSSGRGDDGEDYAVGGSMEDKPRTTSLAAGGSAAAATGGGDDDDDDLDDFETEIRELGILQHQSQVYTAFDNISAIQQEMDLLSHMDDLSENEQRMRHRAPAISSSSSSSSSSTQQQQQGVSQQRLTDREVESQLERFGRILPDSGLNAAYRSGEDDSNKGLEITHITKDFNGALLFDRETIHSNVFVPSMAPPCLTLNEFADRELARATEAQEAAKNAPVGPRRYHELVEAGEEDNEKLVDEATIKEREWDLWKEDNPKGSGNKANKKF